MAKIFNIWLDDIRPAPQDFLAVHSVNEAKMAIVKAEKEGKTEIILDLDHDLGDYAKDGGDGIVLVEWLAETERYYDIRLHTMNPVGRQNMQAIIDRYWPARKSYLSSHIKTIKDVVNEVPITFKRFIHNGYSIEFIEGLYERMGRPRHARCNLLVVLDYIDYLISDVKARSRVDYNEDLDWVCFDKCYYDGTEEWASMTVDEITDCDYIPDICKRELCNIIEKRINETFVFNW